jgi:hypothetical protein
MMGEGQLRKNAGVAFDIGEGLAELVMVVFGKSVKVQGFTNRGNKERCYRMNGIFKSQDTRMVRIFRILFEG